MAKLYFRYGAMNSGKSTALLQVAHNYEERSQQILIAKPAVDTKGDSTIVSRLGVDRHVDFLVTPESNLRDLAHEYANNGLIIPGIKNLACLLIDEAQFLTREQVDQAFELAVLDGVLPNCWFPGFNSIDGAFSLSRRTKDNLPLRTQSNVQRTQVRR